MAIVLFDSNLLIDHFEGHDEATEELLAYDDAVISAITWMEVACKMTEEAKAGLTELLRSAGIKIRHTNEDIMRRATILRGNSLSSKPKKYMPDHIIRATAESEGRIAITRNADDFGGVGPYVHVPYDMKDNIIFNVRPPAR